MDFNHVVMVNSEFKFLANSKLIALFNMRLSQNELFEKKQFRMYFVNFCSSGTKTLEKAYTRKPQKSSMNKSYSYSFKNRFFGKNDNLKNKFKNGKKHVFSCSVVREM